MVTSAIRFLCVFSFTPQQMAFQVRNVLVSGSAIEGALAGADVNNLLFKARASGNDVIALTSAQTALAPYVLTLNDLVQAAVATQYVTAATGPSFMSMGPDSLANAQSIAALLGLEETVKPAAVLDFMIVGNAAAASQAVGVQTDEGTHVYVNIALDSLPGTDAGTAELWSNSGKAPGTPGQILVVGTWSANVLASIKCILIG